MIKESLKLTLMLFLFLQLFLSPLSAGNITKHDPSPYVRMHVADAVQWQQWNDDVIQRAQRENKLIFISSGYYSCHWCHVMQRESFNDKAVAEILNKFFIPVKIDRELEPVVDKYLIDFMKKTQGYAGWPLNVFLTPAGYPITGLVYQPKPKFIETLNLLNSKWLKQPDRLEKIAAGIFRHFTELEGESATISSQLLVDALLSDVKRNMDEFEGGIGTQSKFPRPHLMSALLDIYQVKKDLWLKEFLLLSLKQMAERGLHDAISGGFFRYTVDQGWQVPHFEKMLYVNTSMSSLYLKAYRVFKNEKFLKLAYETMDFIVADLADGKGGYVSALTAQSKNGAEGAAYVWTEGELRSVLNKDQYKWFVKKSADILIEGESLRIATGDWMTQDGADIKAILKPAKQQKQPLKDEKFVIAWNAYLLGVMLELNKTDQAGKYASNIERLFKRLKEEFKIAGRVDELSRRPKFLVDYVFMAKAVNDWHKYKEKESERKLLKQLIKVIFSEFRIADGWRMSSQSVIPLPENIISIADDNLPAADAVLWDLLQALPEMYTDDLDLSLVSDYSLAKSVGLRPMEYSSHISRLASGLATSDE